MMPLLSAWHGARRGCDCACRVLNKTDKALVLLVVLLDVKGMPP